MACRGCLEWLLKLLNFLLTVSGLGMVGYGIYLLVEWNRISGSGDDPISPVSSNPELLQLGRPMLLVVSLSESILDKLPKAWYASFIHSSNSFSKVVKWNATLLCVVAISLMLEITRE